MILRFAPGLLLCLMLAAVSPAHADEDDTRRPLNQMELNRTEQESAHLVKEPPPPADGTALLTIHGTTYRVRDTLEELAPALYMAINLRQWDKVRQFVARYRQLPGHDAALVLMAEGMLARERRDYATAQTKLRTALALNPQFVRAKMELARMLFEDNQSREARALFEQISISGIPEATRPVIEGFQQALNAREAWHGSLSLGAGYNSNINQANGQVDTFQVCYFFGCFPSTRSMPKPIGSAGLFYDLTANRAFQIAGHHHILVRALSYGSYYARYREADPDVHYNDNTSILYAGYDYIDALNDVSITPLFENYYSDRHTIYQAAGARLDWKHNFSQRLQLGFNAQRKHLKFKGSMRQYFDDYDENQFGVYGSYMLDTRTLLYGGLNYTRKLQPLATASSKEYMANIGLYHTFEAGLDVNALALYRRIYNDEEDQFLGGRRKDRQQIYILNIGIPRLAFAGIVPNLYLKHTINASSIDWAYKYDQTEVALKFEKKF